MHNQKFKYGYTGQAKIIICLLTDKVFTSRMYDVINPDYFESEAMSWLCKSILEYFSEYHTLPTLDVLAYKVAELSDSLLQNEVKSAVDTALGLMEETDLDFVKETTLDFCKRQELKLAIYDSVDLINSDKLDDILPRINQAVKKGEDTNVGLEYLANIDDRYTDLSRAPIATGWDAITELMDGGLSFGELGVIVGPGGSGKSWLLTHLCISALKQGKRVLFITLELSDSYVGVRHDTVLTNKSIQELKVDRSILKEKLGEIKGSLTIKWYSTKSLSVTGLRSLMDRMVLLDKKPEILILDYADLMKLSMNSNRRKDEILQELYEDLRGLAGEYNIPIWTASQSVRESNKDDITHIGAELIAESMGKHYTCDFMMSLARNSDDKKLNTAKFYVIKNRFGEDGKLMFGKMDTKRGKIEIFKNKSREAKTIEKLLDETNVNLQDRYRYLMEDDL